MFNQPPSNNKQQLDFFTTIQVQMQIVLSGSWADIYLASYTSRFKFISNRDIVAKEAIAWHQLSNDSSQHSAGVQPNPHLNVLTVVGYMLGASANHSQRHPSHFVCIINARPMETTSHAISVTNCFNLATILD